MTTEAPAGVTLGDVATKAGVSWRTAHRAINDPGMVGDDALARVMKAIEELGYTGELVRRGRKPSAVPLIHQVAGKVDERTREEMARRAGVLTEAHGQRARGWDAEIMRIALDWAFNPPEGVTPMPDDYLGHVDRTTQS